MSNTGMPKINVEVLQALSAEPEVALNVFDIAYRIPSGRFVYRFTQIREALTSLKSEGLVERLRKRDPQGQQLYMLSESMRNSLVRVREGG